MKFLKLLFKSLKYCLFYIFGALFVVGMFVDVDDLTTEKLHKFFGVWFPFILFVGGQAFYFFWNIRNVEMGPSRNASVYWQTRRAIQDAHIAIEEARTGVRRPGTGFKFGVYGCLAWLVVSFFVTPLLIMAWVYVYHTLFDL